MFIIRNTQTALYKELGKVCPAVVAYLSNRGDWTVTRKPRRFKTRKAAEAYIVRAGLTVGRNESPEDNQLNVIEAVRVAEGV